MPAPWVNDINNWVENTFHIIDPNKAQTEADGYQQKAIDQVLGLSGPTLDKVTAEQLGPSAMTGLQADPAARAAQSQALASLMQRGTDGYGIEDRAALNNAMNEANQNAAGRAGALQHQMQARGMGGSGFALAAQLANNQNAAQTSSMAGMNAAAGSRQRALQAMQAGGQMAGQIRGQSFDEGARKAAAQDDINARNAAMRQQANLYNSGLQQTGWEDQMRLAGMKSGAYQQGANAAIDKRNRGEQQEQDWQNSLNSIQNGIAGAATGLGGMGGGGGGKAPGMTYSQAPQQIDMNTPDDQWRY